jgi:hypothetical protein
VQIFNLNLRRQIEYYLTFSNNAIDINYSTDWKGVQKDFAKTYFGGNCETVATGAACAVTLTNGVESDNCVGLDEACIKADGTPAAASETGTCMVRKCGEQLATFIAKNIELILNEKRDYKDFTISFSTGGQSIFEAKETFRKLVGKVITKTVEEETGLFELVEPDDPSTGTVGCSPTNPDKCKGFYLVLDLTKLGPEEYEQLPKIRVASISTARIVEEPVFTYGKFKIFVPIRLFRALAHAYALAHSPQATTVDADTGLLGVKMHNTLEELKLGVCDPGKCGYRTNALQETNIQTLDGKLCSGSTTLVDPDLQATSQVPKVNISVDGQALVDDQGTQLSYLPGSIPSQQFALKNLSEKLAFDFASEKLQQQLTSTDFSAGIKSVGAIATAKSSKMIETPPPSGAMPSEVSAPPDTFDSPKLSDASTLIGPNIGLGVYALDASKPWSVSRLLAGEVQGFSLPSGDHSSCTELTKLSVILEFTETNPLYQVDNKEQPKKYLVELTDYFEDFNPKYSMPFSGTSQPTISPAFNDNAWKCIEQTAVSDVGGHIGPVKCGPA